MLPIQAEQPEKIICIATVVTIKPMILTIGPVTFSFSRKRLIGPESTINARLIKIAMVMQIFVIVIPLIEANVIAAVIMPGPAINGVASGTIEMSAFT